MTQLKHAISQLHGLPPRLRQPLCQHCEVSPTTNIAATYSERNWLRKAAHFGLKSKVQPSTDTNTREVEEYEDEEEYGDEEDIPETFPFNLERKTKIEMMIDCLYVAVADNDREIAALRTRHREKFTHIVRVTFNPLCTDDDKTTPSSWTQEMLFPDDGPYELRLTCPATAFRLGDGHTALTDNQLLAARNYVTLALPNRNDGWVDMGVKFPFLPSECQDARLLIVGPTDRSVDVMAILVCYMAFLTGTSAKGLLAGVQRLKTLVHVHWQHDILGETSIDRADAVAKHEW